MIDPPADENLPDLFGAVARGLRRRTRVALEPLGVTPSLSRALGVLGSLLDPRVKNGLFEWRDAAPGLRYFAGLFRRARR